MPRSFFVIFLLQISLGHILSRTFHCAKAKYMKAEHKKWRKQLQFEFHNNLFLIVYATVQKYQNRCLEKTFLLSERSITKSSIQTAFVVVKVISHVFEIHSCPVVLSPMTMQLQKQIWCGALLSYRTKFWQTAVAKRLLYSFIKMYHIFYSPITHILLCFVPNHILIRKRACVLIILPLRPKGSSFDIFWTLFGTLKRSKKFKK